MRSVPVGIDTPKQLYSAIRHFQAHGGLVELEVERKRPDLAWNPPLSTDLPSIKHQRIVT